MILFPWRMIMLSLLYTLFYQLIRKEIQNNNTKTFPKLNYYFCSSPPLKNTGVYEKAFGGFWVDKDTIKINLNTVNNNNLNSDPAVQWVGVQIFLLCRFCFSLAHTKCGFQNLLISLFLTHAINAELTCVSFIHLLSIEMRTQTLTFCIHVCSFTHIHTISYICPCTHLTLLLECKWGDWFVKWCFNILTDSSP